MLAVALAGAAPDCAVHLAAEIAFQRDPDRIRAVNVEGHARLPGRVRLPEPCDARPTSPRWTPPCRGRARNARSRDGRDCLTAARTMLRRPAPRTPSATGVRRARCVGEKLSGSDAQPTEVACQPTGGAPAVLARPSRRFAGSLGDCGTASVTSTAPAGRSRRREAPRTGCPPPACGSRIVGQSGGSVLRRGRVDGRAGSFRGRRGSRGRDHLQSPATSEPITRDVRAEPRPPCAWAPRRLDPLWLAAAGRDGDPAAASPARRLDAARWTSASWSWIASLVSRAEEGVPDAVAQLPAR